VQSPVQLGLAAPEESLPPQAAGATTAPTNAMATSEDAIRRFGFCMGSPLLILRRESQAEEAGRAISEWTGA
jgi:hypothetical protein